MIIRCLYLAFKKRQNEKKFKEQTIEVECDDHVFNPQQETIQIDNRIEMAKVNTD